MRLSRIGRHLAALPVLIALAATPAAAQHANNPDDDLGFFDPVVTVSAGISREVGFVFDHARLSDGTFTQVALKLQYPVLPWFQLSLEVPVALSDPTGPGSELGIGDLVLQAQANVWTSADWKAQVDLGLAMGLPSGSGKILLGTTSIQPFAAGAIKLGPVDLLADVRYTWGVTGTAAGLQLFQANVAAGYSIEDIGAAVKGVTPFLELNLLKPVRGADDLRPQLFVLPGVEIFLPWNLSVSAGVQLPITSARAFDYRVLMFAKWEF